MSAYTDFEVTVARYVVDKIVVQAIDEAHAMQIVQETGDDITPISVKWLPADELEE